MYVKFISKKDEWFDAGTEVFDGSVNDYDKSLFRITVDDYIKNWQKSGIILGFGLRNKQWDMEVCLLEEFDITQIEEQYEPG